MSETTTKFGTFTTEGSIPHLKRGNLRFPVMLDFTKPKEDGYYPPLRENGRLVYALPGGGKTVSV